MSAHTLVLVGPSTVVLGTAPDLTAAMRLSPEESIRHRRLLRPQDREDFLAARLAARIALLRWAEIEVAPEGVAKIRFIQTCPRCGGAHGRPQVVAAGPALSADRCAGVQVSWSHAHGMVAAAVSAAMVGIDIETFPPRAAPERRTTESRLAWTRAEALVKAGIVDLESALAWDLDWPIAEAGAAFSAPRSPDRSPDLAPHLTGLSLTDRLIPPSGYLSVASHGPVEVLTLASTTPSGSGSTETDSPPEVGDSALRKAAP